MADGRTLAGRSFKRHRPRGLVASGPEEPNALVTLGEGARRAPTRARPWWSCATPSPPLPRTAGRAWSATWGRRATPWRASCRRGSTTSPSSGRASWPRLYEPLIRRAAGLGRAPEGADPDRDEQAHAHCDALVVGSVAGVQAALALGEVGARVILVE